MRRDRARGVTISAGGFKICLELLIRSEPALVIEVPYVFKGRTVGREQDEPEGSDWVPAAAARPARLPAEPATCRGRAADREPATSSRSRPRRGGGAPARRSGTRAPKSSASAICPKIAGLVVASLTMSPKRRGEVGRAHEEAALGAVDRVHHDVSSRPLPRSR